MAMKMRAVPADEGCSSLVTPRDRNRRGGNADPPPTGIRRRISPYALFLLMPVLLIAIVRPVRAQTPENADVRRAVIAYEAGEFTRALAVLDAAAPGMTARDNAIRNAYRGLIYLALAEPARADSSFLRAVTLDPTIRLDPGIHAPSRLRAFEAARALAVRDWRRAAVAAEAKSDLDTADRQWRSVLAALPEDAEALAGIDRVQAARARQAGLEPPRPVVRDSTLVLPPAPADSATTDVVVENRYSPGQAMMLGLVVPGLGEFYTGRGLRGFLVLGASAGAVAFGYLTENIAVDCRTIPVNNTCPPEDILGERSERPYLAPSIGVAAGLALIGAIDAFVGARRANARLAAERSGAPARTESGLRLEQPGLTVGRGGVGLSLLRVRF